MFGGENRHVGAAWTAWAAWAALPTRERGSSTASNSWQKSLICEVLTLHTSSAFGLKKAHPVGQEVQSQLHQNKDRPWMVMVGLKIGYPKIPYGLSNMLPP